MTNDEMIADAELGEEARNFIESDLGKILMGMADQERAFAREELETVDPNAVIKITELQNRAKLGKYFTEWILELLDKGESALQVYKQQQEV